MSLRLFAERGYDAVSISMIAEEIGITKGALYRHFVSKQEIYDKILEEMTELDAERAQADSYENRSFHEFCCFAVNQFDFWTKNEFAVAFRKMLMLEQYKSPEKMKQYQEMICEGPVKYSEDLLSAMIKEDEFLQIILTPFLQFKKDGDEAFCFFG
ncbi:TetR/AcrR family transcriptional regulator [Oribacterium sp. FC2011]|uniref:TetR/AcrR family transcriptional regulator n=1 Tax=Oribacterium sp. FC2011 TaxID=1408311 RepID=UPI0006787CFD|nr:TetR/AcrR family transcriptional regulator [Oribacterium sp. FC2011]